MSSKKAFVNGIIITGYNRYEQHVLLVESDKVVAIVSSESLLEGYDIVDVGGAYISPGFIDLQIYGVGNDLFSADLTSDNLTRIETNLLRQGCTSFYITLATNTLEVFKEAIKVFNTSARINALGLHLEGPFLNASKRGAHPEELIILATVEILADLLKESEGSVKMMTIAPEKVDIDCVEYLLDQKVLLSAGHSNATIEEVKKGVEMGVKTITHLWNAMSPLHHREVGVPGAAFNISNVFASIIVDGIHVDYETVKISKSIMKERLFLITDAVAACDKGIYQHVLNEDHYFLPNGVLSGSALRMIDAVKNCVEKVDIALEEAVRMATLYPADLIERKDLGRLEEGALANLVVFKDNFEVIDVYFEGNSVVNGFV